MKTKILSLTMAFMLILVASGCNWIDSSINTDPTSPSDAPYSTILPTTQAAMAYVMGGDLNRYTSLFTQHHTGTDRQHQTMYNYNLLESDIDNAWTTMYTGPLMDLRIMIDDATENEQFYYAGIAQVLMAVGIGQLSDLVGDIPFSEAFLGNDNLKPKFDSQEAIYQAIQDMLDDAIVNLQKTGTQLIPKSDDLIYGGDLAKWIKAAYSLKARYYLHVKNYTAAHTNALMGFANNSDEMVFSFGDVETQSNPFYQFMQQRGDLSMGPKLMELMGNLTDPRIVTFTGESEYDVSALPVGFYTQINSVVPFITYAEIKFIESECKQALGVAGAYQAYLDAIAANLDYFGVTGTDASDYLASAGVAVGEGNFNLETLINQKYIALYLQMETWTDWRRTGFPKLTPIVPPSVPRRMIYPQTERLYNLENLEKADGYTNISKDFIFSKMWWDRLW